MARDVVIRISATDAASPVFRSIAQSAQAAGAQVEASNQRAGRSAQEFNARMAALGAGVGTVLGAMSTFARSAAEEEAIFARLRQAVENTGKSFDDYSDKIDQAIDKGKELAFSDDQVATALATLTTQTGDATAALENIGLAMDVARARGISLNDAATLVGKVHEGNIGILNRYGIAVEEGATATEALAVLQQRTAGQASAYAETTAGDLDRIRNKVDDLTESIGAHAGSMQTVLALLPGLSVAYTGLASVIGGLSGALGIGGAAAGVGLLGALGPLAVGIAAVSASIYLGYQYWDAWHDNMARATEDAQNLKKELDDLATSRGMSGGLPAAEEDELLKLYSLFASGQYNTGVNNPYTGTERVEYTETLYDELIGLRGEFREMFIAEVKAMGIDLARVSLDEIDAVMRTLIDIYNIQLQSDLRNLPNFGAPAQGSTTVGYSSPAGVKPDYSAYVNRFSGQLDPTMTGATGIPRYMPPGMSATSAVNKWDPNFPTQQAYQQGGSGAVANSTVLLGNPALNESQQAHVQAAEAAKAQRQAVLDLYPAYAGLLEGVVGAKDGLSAFKAVQDGLIESQQVYAGQISEYSGQLDAMTAAHEILNQRQADGVALTAEQLAFQEQYAQALERGTGGVEDAVLAQGMLAQQYLLNMERGDELNRTLAAGADATSSLVDVIYQLILAMDGVPEEVKTEIRLNQAENALAQLYAIHGMLQAIDTFTAVANVAVNSSGYLPGLPFMHGGTIGAYAHGGTAYDPALPRFANGGTWALVGEVGPELVKLSRGDQVIPTGGSRAMLQNARGGGSGLTLNNPTFHIYPETGDIRREITAAVVGDWRA